MTGRLVLCRERPSDDRHRAKNFEEARRDGTGRQVLRKCVSVRLYRDLSPRAGGQRAEHILPFPPIEEILRGDQVRLARRRILQHLFADRNEPVGTRERQWPQHHRVDDGEHGDRRADAQGEYRRGVSPRRSRGNCRVVDEGNAYGFFVSLNSPARSPLTRPVAVPFTTVPSRVRRTASLPFLPRSSFSACFFASKVPTFT